MQRDLLRHAVRGSAGRAGDVGAVPVAIVRTVPVPDEIGPVADSSGELLVRCPDAGVDDVRVDTLSGLAVVVGVVQRQIALVDAVEPPRRRRLGRDGVEDLVTLDVRDAWISGQGCGRAGRQVDGEALERMLVDERDVAAL
jgi:hypothetical protein